MTRYTAKDDSVKKSEKVISNKSQTHQRYEKTDNYLRIRETTVRGKKVTIYNVVSSKDQPTTSSNVETNVRIEKKDTKKYIPNEEEYLGEKCHEEDTTELDRFSKAKSMAHDFFLQEDYRVASLLYENLIILFPCNESLYCDRSSCYMKLKEWKSAFNDIEKCIALNPQYIQGHIQKMNYLIILKKFNEAENALEILSKLEISDNEDDFSNKKQLVSQNCLYFSLSLGKLDQAREALRKCSMLNICDKVIKYFEDKILLVEICEELAIKSFANKNYIEALSNIDEIISICSNCWIYKVKKGECLARLGQYKEAQSEAKELLERDEMKSDAYFILGLCDYFTNPQNASHHFEEVLHYDPNHTQAISILEKLQKLNNLVEQANSHAGRSEFQSAYDCFLDAMKIDEENHSMKIYLHNEMAEMSYKIKEYERAVEESTKSLEIENNNLKALIIRGKCWMDLMDYEDASKDFQIAHEIDTDNHECGELLENSKNLLETTKRDEATILGLKSLSSHDNIQKATRIKCRTHHPSNFFSPIEQENHTQKYFEILNASKCLSDKYIKTKNLIDEANEIFSNKLYGNALQKYSEAIEILPNVVKYYSYRAICYMMLNMFDNALWDAKKCIEIDSNFNKAHIIAFRCYLKVGNIADAAMMIDELKKNDLEKSLEIEELNNFSSLQNYLNIYSDALPNKNYEKMIECMEKCCEISPFCTMFEIQKAECLACLEKYDEALKIARGVHNRERSNVDALYIQAYCHYYQANLEVAAKIFEILFSLSPDYEKAFEIYEKTNLILQKDEESETFLYYGLWQRAYDKYGEALTIDPTNKKQTSKCLYYRALINIERDKVCEAIMELSEALQIDEKFTQAWTSRGDCHMLLLDYEQAVFDYECACILENSVQNQEKLKKAKAASNKSEIKKKKNFYELLNVDVHSSIKTIKIAYRKLALIHHPDKHANSSAMKKKYAEKTFREIKEAYEVLSNPEKRDRYDQEM